MEMDWINENILPVPFWSVVATFLLFVGATIVLFLWVIFPDKPWRRVFIIPMNLATLIIVIGYVVWFSYACTAKELDRVEECEVKVVTFPDGTTAQMFYADGKNRNANEMFGLMVAEDSVVKRYVYKKQYHGIYFIDPRDLTRDRYVIEKRVK